MTDVTFTIRLSGEDRGGEAAVRKVVSAIQDLRTEARGAGAAVREINGGFQQGNVTPALDTVVQKVEEVATAEQAAATGAREMATAVVESAQQAATAQREQATAAQEVAEVLERDIPAAAKKAGSAMVDAATLPTDEFAQFAGQLNELQQALDQGPAGLAEATRLAGELEAQSRGLTAALEELVQQFIRAGGDTEKLPKEFADLAAAYILVEHNAAELHRTLREGSEESLPAAQAAAANLREALTSIAGVAENANQAQEAQGRTAQRGARGTSQLNRAFQALVFSATGIPGVVGRAASALAQFASGGVIAAAVVAGLGVLTTAWRNLTAEIKRNREEADRTSEALVDAALASSGADIGLNRSLLQGELESELAKQAGLRGRLPGTVETVLDQLGLGKGQGDKIQASTERVARLTLALSTLRKQFDAFQERRTAARGESFVSAIEAESQRVVAEAAAVQAASTASFEAGEISVEGFFAARREAMEKAFAAELRAAEAQADELGRRAGVAAALDPRSPEAIEAATAAARARAAVEQLSIQHQTALTQLTSEQATQTRAIVDRVNEFNASLLEAQGHLERASMNRLVTEIEQARIALGQFGLEADEIERRLEALRTARITRFRVDAIQEAVNRAFAETDRLRSEIEAQVAAGLITEREGRQRVLELERSRLPVLAALKKELLAIAVIVQDPATAQALANLVTQIDNAATATFRTGRAMVDLELELRNVAESELVRFLSDTAVNAENAGDAFKQFARDAVAAINEVITRILVMKALDAVGFGFEAGGAVPQRRATGGLVFGPRYPADRVPAWLTGGEYVFDARSVQRGGLPFFQALHAALRDGVTPPPRLRRARGGAFGYAEGGLVAGAAARGGAERISAEIGLDDGLLLRALDSTEGIRTLVRIVAANPKSFNGALGR